MRYPKREANCFKLFLFEIGHRGDASGSSCWKKVNIKKKYQKFQLWMARKSLCVSKSNKNDSKSYHWTISHCPITVFFMKVRIQAICLGQKMLEEYWSRWVNSAPALLWSNMLYIILHGFSSAFQRTHPFFKIFEKKNLKEYSKKLQIALYWRFLN